MTPAWGEGGEGKLETLQWSKGDRSSKHTACVLPVRLPWR